MSTSGDTGPHPTTDNFQYSANPRVSENHLSGDDPRVPQEPTGPVASDSLAAESTRAGGGFADNEDAAVMGVKGGSSTLNTTDTSGASVLHAASSGAAREKQDALGAGSDEKGVSGLKYPEAAGDAQFSGTHTRQGYTGGPSSSQPSAAGDGPGSTDPDISTTSSQAPDPSKITSSASGVDTSTTSSSTTDSDAAAGVRPYVDRAPNAFSDFHTTGQLQPKGKDLVEGGLPQTKTFTGDVGGPHDPARRAERDMLSSNAAVAGAAAGGGGAGETADEQGGSGGSTTTGQFDVLSSERA